MRLIDADAMKSVYRMGDDCSNCKQNKVDCQYMTVFSKMDFCGWIDDAPTVDAVPIVRSYWEKKHRNNWVNCHACGGAYPMAERFKYVKYCPWCGALMDGKDGNT